VLYKRLVILKRREKNLVDAKTIYNLEHTCFKLDGSLYMQHLSELFLLATWHAHNTCSSDSIRNDVTVVIKEPPCLQCIAPLCCCADIHIKSPPAIHLICDRRLGDGSDATLATGEGASDVKHDEN